MPRVRTFIAIGLDPAIHKRVVSLKNALESEGDGVKWVEPDNLHVTLLFLGEVDERRVHEVCKAVAACAVEHEPFALSVGSVGAFPNIRRPRVVWVGLGDGTPELVALHDALEEVMLDLGCYRREERQYSPHVTLGRARGEEVNETLLQLMTRNANWQGGQMTVKEVLVMSSDLSSKGPVYAVMGRAKLGT